MAGENVPENVVRKVFSNSIDLVIHLDREMQGESDGPIKRQVVEILAIVPSLHDDFSVQPLFVRDRIGTGMYWTGALPPDQLAGRLERMLPQNVSLSDVMNGQVSL